MRALINRSISFAAIAMATVSVRPARPYYWSMILSENRYPPRQAFRDHAQVIPPAM
jgi:hypothetical protein